MKHLPIKLNPYLLFILLSTSCLLVSCGAYQNTYNNDGIYGDVQEAEGYRKVIIVDEQEYQEYEDNYFLKKLNSLDRINREDVFTEVDNYNSVDITDENETVTDKTANYNPNQPWGQNDNNDIVINVIDNSYWNNFYGYGYYNNWRYRNWGHRGYDWRFRGYDWGFNDYNWGFNGFGWNQNPFWNPYQNYYAWNQNYYNPYNQQPYYNRFGNPYRNGNYWQNSVDRTNTNYGRRTASNTTYRKNKPVNSRTTGRRSSAQINKELEKTIRGRNKK